MHDLAPLAERTSVACPVCDATDSELELSVRDHITLEHFEVHRCPACTVLYIKDQPPADQLVRYYENEMGRIMHSRPGRLFARLREIRIDRDLRPLVGHLEPACGVIDFGTGDGSVARALLRAGFRAGATDVYAPSGWDDPQIPYRQFDPGAEVTSDAFMVDTTPASGLVLRHVLEHVPRPRDFLAAAHDAGVDAVMLVVPNIESGIARRLGPRWYYWEPPRHLTFFSPASLRACAEAAGYEVAELKTYGIDELVTSVFRAAVLRSQTTTGASSSLWERVARVSRPTGILAGLSSAAATPFGRTVCHAVLVRT